MSKNPIWIPRSKPQTMALLSEAIELFYGGAGGSMKTDLVIGSSICDHQRSIIFRKHYTDVEWLEERSRQIIGNLGRYNGTHHRWRYTYESKPRSLTLAGLEHSSDWEKWQGKPFDFIGFDEVTQHEKKVMQTLSAWNRSADPEQRCRMIFTFNPPTTAEGQWVLEYLAPWLAYLFPSRFEHPNPAKPGELRWYAMINGESVEVESNAPIIHKGEKLFPTSRTFIPGKLSDNPYYGDEYRTRLQNLPEPLRSQMLHGDMTAGMNDDEWQLIPTAWVLAAQERWKAGKPEGAKLSGIGIDVARGGEDNTVVAAGYDWWIAELLMIPGRLTPNGQSVVDAIEKMYESIEDCGRVSECIDVVGVGAAPYDKAREAGHRIYPVQAAGASTKRTRAGLGFLNQRAEMLWELYEALDPDGDILLALPPDRLLVPEITSIRWRESPRGIKIEDKEEIKKRLGRSPDRAEAIALCLKALRKSR